MKLRLPISFAAAALLTGGLFAQTDNTFAQFFQQTGGRPFVFENNEQASPHAEATFNASVAVDFGFLDLTFTDGLSALNGIQNATLVMAVTTKAQGNFDYNRLNQPLDSGYFEFRRTEAIDGKNVLLRVDFENAQLETARKSGGGYADDSNFCSDECTFIGYTSDFLSFAPNTSHNWAISLSSIFPSASLNQINNLMSDFTASGTGTFSGGASVIPEPSTYATALGALALGLASWRRSRR